jgi:hypothetical protein
MTAHKHLKDLVRARMRKTDESYTTARRHILREVELLRDDAPRRWHLPGNIPATTALRVLLAANGIHMSEALLFGICGGIGLGVASFYYDKWDFSSFFIGGRHLWYDDKAYLSSALSRLGIESEFRETSGAKEALKNLREVLASGRPCIAWVDMAELPHRGLPEIFKGGGYHVVTVYEIDDAKGTASIGDLTDLPVEITLDQLATARGRIKQFKNRLLSIPEGSSVLETKNAIRSGMEACRAGLTVSKGKGPLAMTGLRMLEKWSAQLAPSTSKESWDHIFPRGHRLWQGLTSIYDYIENYHTGSGLCRPLFAEFLEEASQPQIAKQYAALGTQWSELALAAIPQNVPEFRRVKELCVLRAELRSGGKPDDVSKIREVWTSLAELQKAAAKDFPLSESQCAALKNDLRKRVIALYSAELEAM